MALNASNVRVAVSGGVYFAPTGTTAPADATTALNAAFVELGYVSEDGVTQTIDADTETITAWQNGDTVREVQTSHSLSYEFTLLESTPDTLRTFYGNHTVASGNGTTLIKGEPGVRGMWVFHVLDGVNRIRVSIPDGQITERGDVEFVNGAPIAFPLTVTAYPGSDGVKARIFTAVVS